MFNARDFLENYNIPYITEGKNTGRGWISIACPFCNDPSEHGGFNLHTGLYNCWRCGFHPTNEVIKILTNTSDWREAKQIEEQFQRSHSSIQYKKEAPKNKKTCMQFPLGTGPLRDRHKNYLIQRNFDPEELEIKYKLLGTGPIGSHSFRIIIPVYWNGEVVSFTGRDITNKSPQRYKSCPKDLEVMPIKNTLYIPNPLQKDETVIVVEGPTDVWRLGDNSVGLFGTSYTTRQIELLSSFKRIFIWLDNEPEAQDKAQKLMWSLTSLGKEVINIQLLDVKDPGSLTKEETEFIKKEILN